ncbi:MAG: PAS-domain containing protein [Rhodospirillales bacterium]|nr:PAS-domain containing protein [Rhodospirillales bacterium]
MDAVKTNAMAAAFAALSDGIMVFDADHRLVVWNERAFEILDLPRAFAKTGTSFVDILIFQARRGEFGPNGIDAVRRSVEIGISNQPENFSRATPSGGFIEVKRNPIPGGGFVALYSDITERAAASRKAAAESRRLAEAMEALGEGFALLDSAERLVMWNRRYAEIYAPIADILKEGVAFDALVRGLATSRVSVVPPDRIEAHVADRVDRIRVQRDPVDVQRADGSWVRLIDRKMSDGGTVMFRVGITDLKRREAALGVLNGAAARLLRRGDWQPTVEALLREIGIVMGVSRAKLGHNILEDGRLAQEDMFEWTAPGVPELPRSSPGNRRPFAADTYADWREALARGEMIVCDIDRLDDAKRRPLAALGLRSILRIPVMAGETWWGTVGFDQCDAERHWTPTEIDTLGAVASFVGLAIERGLGETALRDSEERFRVVAESHPVPVVVVEIASGTIRYASPPIHDLLRVPHGSVVGTRAVELWVDQDDRRRFLRQIQPTGRIDNVEYLMHRGDGTSFPCAISARRIVYEGVECTVGALVDLTESKRIEGEMSRQREALHQSEKMAALGSLLAGVSHELNNPLAIVVGQASLLEAGAEDPRTVERARRITAAADRCARIVRTFLAMARRKAPERAPLDVGAAIEGTLDLLGYLLRSAGIDVRREIEPGLPAVMGDVDQLSQVLSNLLVNAQQALSDRPSPRILRISAAATVDRRHVLIEIADNGAGVPEEIRERIFEPFFTTKPVGLGTGVGLSVCRGIVEGHDGTISVGVAPEGGALFSVRLPVGGAAAAQAAEAEDTPEPARMQARRMLVVDDEPGIAATLAEILELEGAVVDVAHDGTQALALLDAAAYDAVFSDLRMPGMDGPALYREIVRRHPRLAARVAFVTGDTLGSGLSSELAATGAPLVDKPFQPREIRALAARLAGAAD